MPYKFINFGHDDRAYDDVITDALNAEERSGWKVVHVKEYESGVVKVLLHRED